METELQLLNLTRQPVDERLLRRAVRRTLARYGPEQTGELCVLIVGAKRMRRLNRDYHGCPSVTDVLAFAQDEASFPGAQLALGDVVVCHDVARRQAAAAGHSVQVELAFLTVHGVLHLLGEDDRSSTNRAAMLAKQCDILAELNYHVAGLPAT